MKMSGKAIAFASVVISVVLIPGAADACTVSIANGSVYSSIAQAVAAADHISDTLTINGSSGPCNENVFVDNTHLRMIITGINGATINGPAGAATIDLRVKGVEVANLTVTGGSSGIVVSRNTNAWIQNVTVENTGGTGISVNSMAYAIIIGNTIRNNVSEGILLGALASAQIGLVGDVGSTTPTYQGNVIQSNGKNGITLIGNAVGLIYANNIISNAKDGILAVGSSSVLTGGNMINSNGRDGIEVVANSSALIGVQITDFSTGYPEQTTANNARYGIECAMGASMYGHLGSSSQLNGNLGQWGSPDASCPDANKLLLAP